MNAINKPSDKYQGESPNRVPSLAHLHIRISAHQCYILILLIFLIACSSEKKQGGAPLFDLKKYFQSQVTQLQQTNPKVQKLVIQNGQAESRDMQIADWSIELKPFLETDISKPALRNSYSVDTLNANHILYIAVDSSQAIRKVDLQFNKDNVAQISIDRHTGSKLLETTQTLTWDAGKSYSISGKQTVILGKENTYMIKASFLK